MLLHRRRHGIQPMRRAQEISQIVVRPDIFDSELKDVKMRGHGELNLAEDLLRVVRMRGEDQHHRFALLDRARDLARKRTPRLNIAWRDPATYRRAFQRRADGVCDRLVLGRMRDEYV